VSRYLMIDIGAGTMDILYYDDTFPQHYKAVVKSPVIQVAEQIEAISGKLLVTGSEMGGGPVTRILKAHAKTDTVVISRSAAATLNHDVKKIEGWGITVVSDMEAENLKNDTAFSHVYASDLNLDRLANIVRGLGVPFSFDVVGVCAQDHGVPPKGVSHLDFRHKRFVKLLGPAPFPDTLLYEKAEIPREMNRLRSIAHQAALLPTTDVYVMDSGMAAILGASTDLAARGKHHRIVLDVATSHTVAAVLADREIAGFFEYHTHDITLERLESLIRNLADGNLSHAQILSEGGHGCYLRQKVGFDHIEAIIATGPKRSIVHDSDLPVIYGAPMGDNMMTGTAGLLSAINARKNIEK